MKWWKGGLVGVGVGAVTATFLNYGLHAGKGLDMSDGRSVLILAPAGAVIGFFVGGIGASR